MLHDEFERLAKSVENITEDQSQTIIGIVFDSLFKLVKSLIIVDLWVLVHATGADVLRQYTTRERGTQRNPKVDHISLVPNATGLLAWVSEKQVPLWLDDLDKIDRRSPSARNLFKNPKVEARDAVVVEERRFFDIYESTKNFAAVPIEYRGQFWGILSMEADEAGAIKEEDLELMQQLAEPLALMVTKSEYSGERKKHTHQIIEAFEVIANNLSRPKSLYRTGFVARPFSQNFASIEDAIKSAFESEGVRLSSYVHREEGELVVTRMLEEIHASHFGIADVTGLNANVLIELGAMTMIKSERAFPFVILQDASWAQKNPGLPFDITGYNVHSYDYDTVKDALIIESASHKRQTIQEFVKSFVKHMEAENHAFKQAKKCRTTAKTKPKQRA